MSLDLKSWQPFVAIALLVSIAPFLIHEIYSLDIWWQVTIGKDILTELSIPEWDHFSRAGFGRPYHDSHWFFQVLVGLADLFAGMIGVQLVMVSIWSLILYCCWRGMGEERNSIAGLLLVFLAAMACVERFLPRPETISFLMIACFYWRLREGKYDRKLEWLLFAVLQCVWVNSHGLFVIGPFMVGCYWLAELIKFLRRQASDLKPLSLLLISVLFATFVSPFGFDSWQYAFLLFEEAGPGANDVLKSVGELSPTFGAAARAGSAFWFFFALLLLSFVAISAALYRREFSLPRAMICLALLAAALTGRRNVVLFAIVSGPFIVEHLPGFARFEVRRPAWVALSSLVCMMTMAWWGYSGKFYVHMEFPARFGLGATPSFFPYGLSDDLKSRDLSGQVFNSNIGGGFFLYHFYPESLPLTDGRWEIYDVRQLNRIRNAPNNPFLWQEMIDQYDIESLVLLHASVEAEALLPKLPSDPMWVLVYLDKAASVWLKHDRPTDSGQLDMKSKAFSLLETVTRVDDAYILDRFLAPTGLEDVRVENFKKALRFGHKKEELLAFLGQTQVKLARYREAESTFSKLLSIDAENQTALNEMSFLAYQKGQVDVARSYLERLLQVAPDHQDAKANLKVLDGLNVQMNR